MANIMRFGGGVGGAKLGVTLNEDGTQNLFITDNNTALDLLVATADATATPADVASGKTFYAQGEKKTGTAVMEPVLLWTNPSPTSAFKSQTLTFAGEWSAFLVEVKYTNSSKKTPSVAYLDVATPPDVIAGGSGPADYIAVSRQIIAVTTNSIEFGSSYASAAYNQPVTTHCVPTRIWGVKFTLD